MADSANNPILDGFTQSLMNLFDATLKQIPMIHRNHAVTLEEHKAIYEALEKRSPVDAFASMYRHLSNTRAKILKKLEDSGTET
ncbi:FCD domain-containing protein [Paenibacillus alkalitolerans]|uniref:FCD domain-containing protein n=1 Tax=Paenibacillus alkalitolerans TaxID=2799335 RepID=UPI002D7F153E|nr:FCD domain-containing protein [Paenibacillus alkalitolerans]